MFDKKEDYVVYLVESKFKIGSMVYFVKDFSITELKISYIKVEIFEDKISKRYVLWSGHAQDVIMKEEDLFIDKESAKKYICSLIDKM